MLDVLLLSSYPVGAEITVGEAKKVLYLLEELVLDSYVRW